MGALKKAVEMLKDDRSGGETPPGLKNGKFFSDIGKELKQQVEHGAHELAAALFHGNAFVMYPREDQAKEDPQREQERGGREM